MYTEVKEVVNFVCRYMFGRVPRRATGIFGAELGNFLVSQFASSWDTRNPQSGENERVISINCTEGSSKCFESSAMESGLPLEEVLAHLPARIRIHTNPGDVQMLIVDNGVKIPIWSGDVNADDNYQPIPAYIVTAASSRANPYTNLGAAGQPVLFGKKPLPTNDLAVLELVNGIYVPLGREESDELNSNLCHLQEMFPYRFVFKPTSAQTFTGLEFSQTRFGSSKARPDLQTMVNIKQLSSAATGSSSSSSPTFEQNRSGSNYNYFNY